MFESRLGFRPGPRTIPRDGPAVPERADRISCRPIRDERNPLSVSVKGSRSYGQVYVKNEKNEKKKKKNNLSV